MHHLLASNPATETATSPTAMMWVFGIAAGLYVLDRMKGKRAVGLVLLVVAVVLVVRVASAKHGVGSQ